MRNSLRRGVIAIALSIPLVLGTAATAAAAPHTSTLQVPVVTGPEIGPAAVPGGLIQTVPIRLTVGEQPGVVDFAAADIAAWHSQYPYRWLGVQWRNLATGASGTLDLRHWLDLENSDTESYGRSLPLEVTAETGSGPVFVTVTHHREQYEAPSISNALVPGLGVIFVP
ncbi:hypothetical protein [Rhodococcoides kyotonense]|uniref:Secreted protein n=1 Tax=Rhodococcoides kyotonense TaxID=398843 RepID=A0A239MCL5_9NOCA|nr:hypothetical protein [Rhodococcus kyotonensis]SNT40466.1 hypothetical protein SAMN05421642_11769 [Rhodococcus kyotonensis]